MREMKDSGIEWIGEIPCDWKLERSQWHLEEVNTSNNPIQTNNVLSLTNKLGVVPYEEKGNQGNKSKENVYEYKLAYPNTIVANSMNILIGSVGLCDYFGCVSPVYYVFKAKKHNNIKFLNYVFQTVGFQRELRKYANGILEIRLRVSASDILKRFIPFPSENEQQRIAEFLDRECGKIDGLKTDIQAQIDTLEQYKRSVITEAVTHGLNPSAPMKDSGINYISEYPIAWSLRRLKYILNERNERSVTGTEELLSVSLYKGVIPSTEMANRTMQADSLIGYKRVHNGDLVFNKLNPGMARFGCSNYDGITSPDFAVYIVNENYCNAKFLQYLLKTDFYVEKIKSVSMGVGDGFTRLYSNQLYEFFVALPPRDEVSSIINYLDNKCAEIEQIIADKKLQIETLDGYKKSLIYEYVTGKKEIV